MAVLAVTLNAALDVTYAVERLEVGRMHRVEDVAERAGGKGINVARVLHGLGVEVVATGLLGGDTGRAIARELAAAGLAADFEPIGAASRRTINVTERAGLASTLLNEPGPPVTEDEWERFVARWPARAREADVVVLSGSLPPGVPVEAYRVLAQGAGAPVILDADGDALMAGLAAAPAIVKPNAEELARAAGVADPGAGAQRLRAAGAQSVVVSLGAEGVLASTPEGRWRARPPEAVAGNPTGAGDALVAGLARGLVEGAAWEARLADAVALSAAAVRGPLAGDIDRATYARLAARIAVAPA